MGDETTQVDDLTEDDEEIEDEKPAVIDPAALVAQIVEQVGEQTGKEIDRRINALVKTLGTDYGLKKAEPAKEQPKNQSDDRVLLRLRKGAVAEAVSLAKFPGGPAEDGARRVRLRRGGGRGGRGRRRARELPRRVPCGVGGRARARPEALHARAADRCSADPVRGANASRSEAAWPALGRSRRRGRRATAEEAWEEWP